MDENKITPELDNTTETQDSQVNPETEEIAEAQAVAESVEVDSETDVTEDNDNGDAADASEENAAADVIESVQEDEVYLGQPEAPKKKKRKGLKIVLGIFVALVLCFVALIVGAIIYVNNATKLSVDADEPAITIDDVEINAGEYIYMYSYFSGYYSSYYTPEQIAEYATEQLIYVNSLYKKAVEAGYTLSEEDTAEIDKVIASVEQQAEAYSVTVDEMVEDYFCEDYTVDMFRAYLEKEYLANKYYADETTKIQSKYTGKDAVDVIEKEYNSNKTAYDLSDASYAYFDATEEDAQATVDAIIAKVKAGSSFEDAVKAVKADASIKSLKGYTMSVIESNFSQDVAKWLFAMENGAYVNGTGSVTSIADEEVIYVVYANGEPYRNEQIPVTVDYIKVEADTDTTVKSEDELLAAAKATASKILKDFEATEKTADDFYALADTYNKGDNKLISGDKFADIIDDGTHEEALAAWAFDANRKVGDYALVEGDGCYYIVFFAEKNEHAVWYQSVAEVLLNADLSTWSESIIATYEDVTVKHDDVINAVIKYLTAGSMIGY